MTDWVSTKMARQMLGVSATTIKRWANERKMPSMRTAGGHRRFKRSDIQRILGGQVTMSDSPALKEHWLDWLDWLEPDELQLAIEVAQRKRRNLLDAQPRGSPVRKNSDHVAQGCGSIQEADRTRSR